MYATKLQFCLNSQDSLAQASNVWSFCDLL